MPSWWGKSSSKEVKKKTNKESLIDTLHRKFKIPSESKPNCRSGVSCRHGNGTISEERSQSCGESRSPLPFKHVSRCQSFVERPHAQPLPLPDQHPAIVGRTGSGISISSKLRPGKGSKASLFLPLPRPACIRHRLNPNDIDGDYVTASVCSESSTESDDPTNSYRRSLRAIDYDNGTRTAASSPPSVMLKDQSSMVSQNNSREARKQANISFGNSISPKTPKRRPLSNHVANIQIPHHGAFSRAPDSSMSSPSRCPMRAFGTEQVMNSPFWAGKTYTDVTLLGSGPCSSPGSGQNSGHNSMGGDMSGQLFWQPSRGSPEYSPIPSPRMTSAGPSSRIHSGAVTPIHPRSACTATESHTGWHDDGKQHSHRLPLPPVTISISSPFSHSNSAATSPSVPRSPGGAENLLNQGSRWIKGKLLGRGTFGHVYVGFNSKSGEMCAMKEVTLFSDDAKSKESARQLMQEIALLSGLQHPNIVQYYGSEKVDDKLYIYLEYVSGGSIYKILQDYGQLGELAIRSYTHQILSGLAYLHSKSTVHRDIKGANILVDPNGRVKLADFGMAKHIAGQSCPLSFKGNPYWLAPEIIRNPSGCNLAVDIWSLGCTVLEMATTKPPWSQYEGVAAMFKIGNSKELPPIPDYLSDEGKDFVRQCLQRNPLNRPTAVQLLGHPFVKYAAPLERPITDAEPSDPTPGVTNGVKTLISDFKFSKQQRKNRLWCEHCKKPGHMIDQCWKLHGKPANLQPTRSRFQKEPHIASQDDSSSSFNKKQIEELQQILSSMTTKPTNVTYTTTDGNNPYASSVQWIIDSGASDHIIGNIDLLEEYSESSLPASIKIADGSLTTVKGSGSFTLNNNLLLHNVIYAQGSKRVIGSARLGKGLYTLGKRKNRHLLEVTRSFMFVANAPKYLWGEALLIATYLINRMPSKTLDFKIPTKPIISLPITVSPKPASTIPVPREGDGNNLSNSDELPSSFSKHSSPCKTPSTMTKNAPNNDPETITPQPKQLSVYSRRRKDVTEEISQPNICQEPDSDPVAAETEGNDGYQEATTVDLDDFPIAIRKGRAFTASINTVKIPRNVTEAFQSPEWKKAVEEEIKALQNNKTLSLTDLPKGKRAVGCRWIFTVKYHSDGSVKRYKARLVAKVAVNMDWKLHQLDIKNAFLNGNLEEDSPRAWFDRFAKAMTQNGFKQSQADHTLFRKITPSGKITLLIVYVDDMIIADSDIEEIEKLKMNLAKEFETKDLGSMRYFLGMEVARSEEGLVINQRKYVLDLLAETGMLDCKPVETPMEPGLKFCKDQTGNPINKETYQRLVGKLIYLSLTRPDIAYSVSIVSQHMSDPREEHLEAVNRILRFLKFTPGAELIFRKNQDRTVKVYTDASWGGELTDKRALDKLGFIPPWSRANFLFIRPEFQNCTLAISIFLVMYLALFHPYETLFYIQSRSGAKFEVTKFDGLGNFELWKTRVKDLLAQQGILKALRPTKPASIEEEDWEELQRAKGTIRLCLVDEVMYHVMHLSSPDKIWRKLESQFMSKSLTTKLYLKQRLYGLKMQDDHDLAQHVNVFNQIVSDLARLDRLSTLRRLLQPCWLTTSGSRMQGKTLKPIAYIKGNRDRGRKPEKAGSGKRNSRSKSRDKKTIHCYKCKEAGHMKRDCSKLKKQTDEKRDVSSKSVNVVEDDNSDCSEGDMLSISTTQLTDEWIFDSGCSYHITPNREWFSTYRSVNSGSVYLGDDRCCNIVGIGDVRIKMYDGSVWTLNGVRHIPDLKKNLISLGTLHKNGFIPKAYEDRETIRIVKGALTVMKGKMTAGNIYRLLGSTIEGGVHSVESCDDTTKLWHMRLAHLSERGMIKLHKRNLLHGIKSCKLDFCKYCVLGKQTKVRFKIVRHTTQGILDYLHSDKSEVFEKFKLWKAEVENQTGRKIKCLRSENGTEYTNSQFLHFCKEHGIKRYFTVRKTPQQNGVTERMNRSLNKRARCLRLNPGLPKYFWAEAVNLSCYLINRSSRASLAGKVAEEVWTGHDVSFDNLHIFGCPVYVHVPADERSKLDAKSKECIFLGYKKGVKGFKFWDPVAKKIVISRDVVFDEQSMLQQKKDTTVVDFEQFPVEKPETSQPISGGSTTDDLQDYSLARDRVRRMNIKPPSRLGFEDFVSFALIVSSDDQVNFHDAVTSPENDKWMVAMVEEMESLNHNRTWELVRLPEGKSRLVANGYTLIRAVLALVASWDLHLEQMDVKTTFLHGNLEEQIYMRQLEGFTQPGNEHLVCRLKKSLYGLKQSSRQWYKRFNSYMIKIGYNRCEYDCCVYVKSLDDGSFIFLLLYVDDMLIAAKNMDDVIGLKTLLSQEFDMKDLGAAKKILGMEICRDRDSWRLWLSQWGYVEKMLERFAMSSTKPVSTPLANHFKLSSEQCPKTDKEAEDMAKVLYSNVVGCLMYAMVCTRPDLAHVVSQVYKYMSKPGKQHWEAIKWIFRYLKGTVGYGIIFGSQRDNPLVVGYVDSDYAGGVQLLCDNQSAIHLAKNQVYRARTKHIDVRFHKIRELVASEEILFQKVHTDENAADMFTKPVTTDKFKHCLDLLNVSSMTHKYTGKEDRGWSGVSEANINCPYKESLVEEVTIMWVGGAGLCPRGTRRLGTEDVSTLSNLVKILVFFRFFARFINTRLPQHLNGRISPSLISTPWTTSGSSTPLAGGSGAIPFGYLKQSVYFQEGFGSMPKPSNGLYVSGSSPYDNNPDIFRGLQASSHIFFELMPSENDVLGMRRSVHGESYDGQSVLADRVSRQLLKDHVAISPSLDLSPSSPLPNRSTII
ncbi:Mitogen-activated protein kinase kinase kinase YODA [Hibiscus syriacus]|uniref:mitogen-activated protein kinase kinase kinase n=2 Tax=Magnoliopsida TaxID=3398 RepID=A0A6A3AMP5_HIBSY|nr:Mitogen-activated protein kinase kinase kinase YODA [Hibiscus syriacus]